MCLSHCEYEQIVHVRMRSVINNRVPRVVLHLCAVSIRRASLRLTRSAWHTADSLEASGGCRWNRDGGGGLGGIGEVGAVHTLDIGIGTRSTRSSLAVRRGIEGSYPCAPRGCHWLFSDWESYLDQNAH